MSSVNTAAFVSWFISILFFTPFRVTASMNSFVLANVIFLSQLRWRSSRNLCTTWWHRIVRVINLWRGSSVDIPQTNYSPKSFSSRNFHFQSVCKKKNFADWFLSRIIIFFPINYRSKNISGSFKWTKNNSFYFSRDRGYEVLFLYYSIVKGLRNG